MKAFNTVVKICVALAAVAGAVYVVATYGDKIVEWAKKILAKLPCQCCDCDGECECECSDAPVAEEAAEEVAEEAAEEAAEEVAEEVTVEEAPVIEEDAVVADEADFQ